MSSSIDLRLVLVGRNITHSLRNVRIWSFSGLHFPQFRLNLEGYWEMREIRSRKAASTDTSCSDSDFTSYSLKALDFTMCTHPSITCSKLPIEALGQSVKYVQS